MDAILAESNAVVLSHSQFCNIEKGVLFANSDILAYTLKSTRFLICFQSYKCLFIKYYFGQRIMPHHEVPFLSPRQFCFYQVLRLVFCLNCSHNRFSSFNFTSSLLVHIFKIGWRFAQMFNAARTSSRWHLTGWVVARRGTVTVYCWTFLILCSWI